MLSGASLTTEKAYLMGKFARVCLKTPYIDYNGRLCMVSAAAANKKAFGIDRAANPWADILKAKVVWISGANIAECVPITTHYVWQAREHGAKVIMVDPRITPVARTCDLFLPVKPGRDVALFNGILHLMIENDWIDHDFIQEHTVGFEKVAEHVQDWTPRRTAEVTGIAERSIRRAAEWWGTAPTSFLMHARGIEHHTHGVQNCLGAINIVLASGRIGREGCGYATITGQGNGQGGREHGQKCDQLPGGRDIDNPEHRAHVAKVWGVDPDGIAPSGVDAYEIFRKIDRGEIRGLLSICFNPMVSLPDSHFVEPDAGETGILRRHRLLPERDGAARRHRPARLAAGGGRGRRHADRGSGHQDQQGGRTARRSPPGLAHHSGHRPRPRPRARLHVRRPPRDLRGAAPRLGRRRRRLLRHHLREDREASSASSGPVRARTIPARRGSSSTAPGTRSPRARAVSTSPTARPASTSPPTRRPPRTWTTSIRSC